MMKGPSRVFRMPRWGIVLSTIGTLVFTALAAGVGTWVLLAPMDGRGDLVLRGAGVGIAIWLFYLAYLGFLLARHGSDAIEVDEHGITVSAHGRAVTVLWAEGVRARRSALHQVLELSRADGRRLTIVDYWMPGFEELSRLVDEHADRATVDTS